MSFTVALVGMPNVGKSTLFNRMIKGATHMEGLSALTHETPGVTRDRNYGKCEWDGKRFIVIDTGGFYYDDISSVDITLQVKEQALSAIYEADLILHVMDSKAGINPFDHELAHLIRNSGKRFLFVVNKTDTHKRHEQSIEFYNIGGEIVFVSALTGLGFDDLMEKILFFIPHTSHEHDTQDKIYDIPKIAVIGRPNVGKSTLINSLLNKKRLIVSPVPGTTRDSIDVLCTYYGKKYLFIDTAGIRKGVGRSFLKLRDAGGGRYAPKTLLERMTVIKAIKSIQRADIVLIVIDASEGIFEQDQRIAGMVREAGKGAIFLLNKWDLIEKPDIAYKNILKTLKNKLWFINYAPVLTISSLQKKRISKIFPLIDEIYREQKRALSFDEINMIFDELTLRFQNIMAGARDFKIKKIEQSGSSPPTFSIYTTNPSIAKENIITFTEKIIRNKLHFKGTPLKIFFKSR